MQSITIEKQDDYFIVRQGSQSSDPLTWGELLSRIISLTDPRLSQGDY